MTSDTAISEIQKISVSADECLVIIVPVGYTGNQMKSMADNLRAKLPMIADRIMIVTEEVQFATIKMHEAAEFETRPAEIPLIEMERNVWQ